MTDKTQLEQIAGIIKSERDSGGRDLYGTAQKILDICQPQWIPVTKRLPITESDLGKDHYKTIDVNVLTKHGNVYSASFHAGNIVKFWSQFKGYRDGMITDWLPLPRTPHE